MGVRCYVRYVPADIIRRIGAELASSDHRHTLANLCVTSREAHYVCTPLLYAELVISAKRSTGLLDLSPRDVEGFPGFDADGQSGGWETDTTGDKATRRRALRRLISLSYVKRVVVRSLPPDHLSASFGATAAALAASSPTPVFLFPCLQSVSLLADAVDALRIWTPDDYSRPRNPPLLEALSAGSRPSHLCISFRLVPSMDWEMHREMTTAGQYAFVRKILLLADSWSLESVTNHDIVHQVPPTVPGATNIYHFAPHVIPHGLFTRRYNFPTGRQAVGLPGPEWNIRPWQMSLATKNMFPSGGDHTAVLARDTRWVFCGLANHVLTKMARDDDDSTGVLYTEAESMIKESIHVGLERDLPARGITAEQVQEIWSRMTYEKPRECQACHRDPDVHFVSTLDGL